MKKSLLLVVFALGLSILNINAGILNINPNSHVTARCEKGEVSANFTIQSMGDTEGYYTITILNTPSQITDANISVTGPNHANYGVNEKLTLLGGVLVVKSGDLFTVTFKATVSEKGVYSIPIEIKKRNGDEVYSIDISLQAKDNCNIPTGFGTYDITEITRAYSHDAQMNTYETRISSDDVLDFLTDRHFYVDARVTGGGYAESPFNWKFVLNHSSGTYLIGTDETIGTTSSTAQFDIPALLPDYKWARDENGDIIGCITLHIEDDNNSQNTAVRVALPYSPNKGKINSSISQGSTNLFAYTARGATSYNLRYTDIDNGAWTTNNNNSEDIKYLTFPPNEYYLQVQGVNDEGVGSWSDNYIVYSERTPPFQLLSTNSGMANNWDVIDTNGGDRAFEFKLLNRATITATTDFSETDFDTRIEIFDENKISTGLYNDDSWNIAEYASTITNTLDAGTYYLVVDGYDDNEGNFKLSLTVDETIYTLPFNIESSNTGESNDFDVNGSDGADKAFKFYLPHDANLDISTCFPNTDYDTKIEVFNLDGSSTGLYNDDSSDGCSHNRYASAISEGSLTAGTYYLVVDGYGGRQGDFVVDVKEAVVLKSSSMKDKKTVYNAMSDTDDLGKYKNEMQSELLETISIYPNPANQSVSLNTSSGQAFTYELFDATGRQICSNNEMNTKHKISTSTLEEGVYFINLRSADTLKTEKLTIKH